MCGSQKTPTTLLLGYEGTDQGGHINIIISSHLPKAHGVNVSVTTGLEQEQLTVRLLITLITSLSLCRARSGALYFEGDPVGSEASDKISQSAAESFSSVI